MATYFTKHDPALDERLIEACLALRHDHTTPDTSFATLDDYTHPVYTTMTMTTQLPLDVSEYHIYLQAGISTHFYGHDNDEHGDYIEIDFRRNGCRTVLDDTNMSSIDLATLRIYATEAKGPKKSTIDRDTDSLSKEELESNKTLVDLGILEEIRIWCKCSTFLIKKKCNARNILTQDSLQSGRK